MNSLVIVGNLASDCKVTQNEKGGASITFTVFVNEYDYATKENVGIPVYCRYYASTDKARAYFESNLLKGKSVVCIGSFTKNLVRENKKDGGFTSLLCADVKEINFNNPVKADSAQSEPQVATSNDDDDLPF